LRPLLEDARLTTGGVRSRSEILAELVSDRSTDEVDLGVLRRHVDAIRARGEP
jgi:hypothetical protein